MSRHVGTGTYSVPRLLDKDLREPDHLSIVIELFSQVDHGVGRVLLVAFVAGGEEGHERGLGDGLTFCCATRCSLVVSRYVSRGERIQSWRTYTCLDPGGRRLCDRLRDAFLDRARVDCYGAEKEGG
jgi:hypothetical protein